MTRFVIGNVGVFPFSGSAEVTGNLQVSGAGNHPGAVLEVMGPATGPGLRVTGNAEITGDLLVKGTTVTVDSATNLKVEGELSSSGPLVVTSQAQVKGNLLLSGSTTIGGVMSASSMVISGSTILKDTLNVSGATTLATTLNANGDVQAAKDVHVVGGLTVSGSLQVGLFSSSAPIQTSDQMRVGETLHVSGALFAGGILSGSTHFQTAGDMRVGENLDVSGSVRSNTFTFAPGGNKMTFQSDSDYNRDIHVGGSVTVSGTYLRAEELQLLGGSRGHLSASGDSVFLGGVVNKSTLKVSGTLTAGGDIEATKDVHIAGGITVSGSFQAGLISSSAPIQTADDLRVGEDLFVSGTANINSIANASFTGDANFANDLSVSGTLFISSSVESGSYPVFRVDHKDAPDAHPLVFVTGSGRVGILTDSPQAALDVDDDTDTSARIGRAHIGYDGSSSDYAIFAHRDNATSANYALQQRADGTTILNTKTGQSLSLRVGNNNAVVLAGASNNNVGFGNLGTPIARVHITGSTPEQRLLRVDGMNNPDNPALFVTGTGHVGIRTASPSAVLSIVGDLSASTNIQAARDIRAGEDLFVSGAASVGSLTANDGNITNVGTLEVDTVQSDEDTAGLNINFDGNTGTNKLTLKDDLASALDITEGSNSYMKFVTTNSGEEIQVSKKITSTALIAKSGSGGVHIGNIAAIANHSASAYLAVSGAQNDAATLVQFAAANDGNSNQPAYNLVQDSAGRAFQSWNMPPQTTYAMYFNISNGANSTMFIANGTVLSLAPFRLQADFSSSSPIQTSNEMRVGETLVVSSSVGIGDIAGTTLGTTGSHLHIRSADDAAIRLEADTDNATETHNAYLFMTQDGGGTRGIVGLNGNAAADPAGVFLANAASNAMIVGARTAGSPLQLVTNNRVKMTITDDGLVGLGQDFNGTINPVALLHISGGGDDQGSSANAPMMRVDYGDLDNIFHISRSGSVGVNIVPTHALTVAGDISGSTAILSKKDLKAHDANIEAMLKVSGNVRLGLSSSTAVTVNTETLDSYKAPQFFLLSGTTTVKLPGNHPAGSWFVFKAANSHFGPTADTITLSATAGDTIDGSTTYVIQSPFASVNCVSDGANWFIW